MHVHILSCNSWATHFWVIASAQHEWTLQHPCAHSLDSHADGWLAGFWPVNGGACKPLPVMMRSMRLGFSHHK